MADRRKKRTVVRVLLVLAALAVAAVAAGGVWLATRGNDFLWSKVRADDAAQLAGEEIPDEVAPDAWREDLDHLAAELSRSFPRFDEAVEGERFEAELEAVRELLPELDRDEALFALMMVTKLPTAGAGHTALVPFQRPIDWGFYPFHAYLFDDGVWITAAGGAAAEALGAQVLAVGGAPVQEVLDALEPALSADNACQLRLLQGTALGISGLLRAIDVAEPDGSVELRLQHDGAEPFDLRLEPVALASLDGLRWGRALHAPADGVWSPADPRPRAAAFRLEPVMDGGSLLLELNAVRDQPDGETFAEMAERLGRFLEEQGPEGRIERLIIDLRANGGGDNQLVEPLVELLSGHPWIDRPGRLYVLIGRRTYSAAGSLAAALERRTRAIFVGEGTGARPNHYGDAVTHVLPRSKVLVRISSRYWEDGGPYDRREALQPDVAVPFRHDHHFDGRDAVLEAALAHEAEPLAAAPVPAEVAAALTGGRWRFDPFRTLEVRQGADGLRMEVEGVDRFVSSGLYPAEPAEEPPASARGQAPGDDGGEEADGDAPAGSGDGSGATRLATDLPGVFLEVSPPAAGGTGAGARPPVALDWRGRRVELEPLDSGFRLPIELLRDGRLEEGLAAYRRLAAAGEMPDARTEFALNALGYELLEGERIDEAVEVFRLQTELFPRVANSWDSLGDAHRRAGEPERAAEAYREALERDPGFGHSRRMLAELEGSG